MRKIRSRNRSIRTIFGWVDQLSRLQSTQTIDSVLTLSYRLDQPTRLVLYFQQALLAKVGLKICIIFFTTGCYARAVYQGRQWPRGPLSVWHTSACLQCAQVHLKLALLENISWLVVGPIIFLTLFPEIWFIFSNSFACSILYTPNKSAFSTGKRGIAQIHMPHCCGWWSNRSLSPAGSGRSSKLCCGPCWNRQTDRQTDTRQIR